jgi:colicin import membrane protein
MQSKKAILISLGLHSALLVALLVSVDFGRKPAIAASAPSQPIQAVFIDAQAIADQKRKQEQAEAQARQQEREKREQREREQAAERERIKKAADARKKKEQEEARKREQERQRTLEEQRQREQEIQRRIEEENKRKEALEREIAQQLEQEQAARSAANQRRVMSEVEKYQALVHQTIVQNLFDFDSFIGRTCRLNVRLAPNGLVIDVRILDGNDALCRASRAAVLRPDTLPVSKDPAVFAEFKDFNITVRPESQ